MEIKQILGEMGVCFLEVCGWMVIKFKFKFDF